MEEFLTPKVSRPWPWIGSRDTTSCSTHWPLPTHQISSESDHRQTLFVDGCTDVCKDKRKYGRQTGFIRSTQSRRRPKRI